MLGDIRLGIRSFRRQWWLAAAAVLSTALGIGANTAIFSVLYGVVLNPLPYERPDRLVIVWETSAENPARWVAPANFVDWRRELRSFASLAAFDTFSPTLSGRGDAERLRAMGVSGTFFTTLGAEPTLGRTLLPSDDRPDAPAAAVLSAGFWRRMFGASPAALGQTLILDGRIHTVVGVMRDEFATPLETNGIDVWVNGDRGVPRTFPFGGDVTAVRDSHIIFVVGRLAEGVSRERAQQEATALMQELARRHPETNAGLGVNVVPLHEAVVGNTRPLLVLLQVAVVLMLLIACANVAHLLLVRAAGRQTELATRMALGAGRGRLMRQFFGEALTIAIPGGLLGVVLAIYGLQAVVHLAPANLPRVGEIGVDVTVLAFAGGVMLLTALLFGIGPALQMTRTATFQEANLRVTSTRRVKKWHHGIVVLELALAEVLLVGAALLVASFVMSQRVELGFASSGRVAADLNLAPDRYLATLASGGIDTTAKIQFVDHVIETLTATSGVQAVAASFTSPFSGAPNRGISIPGRPRADAATEDNADFQVITPGFFRAAGMTLVRGRDFSAADRAESALVAIVNMAFAERYFHGAEAIGRRFTYGGDKSPEIVGIVANARYRSVEAAADPTFFLPITQNHERWPFLSFTAWTSADPDRLAPIVRDAIRRADPNQPVTRIRTYDALVASALSARRFNTTLVTMFAAAALLLAAVGTYGVTAYAASMRTRELGLRAALGARPAELIRLVFGQGLGVIGIAVALGMLASALTVPVMSTMLYGVQPRDWLLLTMVAGVVTAIAGVATWVPARRAAQAAPLNALRE